MAEGEFGTDPAAIHIVGGPRRREAVLAWVVRRGDEGARHVGDLFAGDPQRIIERQALNVANTASALRRHAASYSGPEGIDGEKPWHRPGRFPACCGLMPA